MSVVCPTVTPSSDDPHEYREQIERIAPFATRIQVDLMDGDFASPKNINPIQVWWPETVDMVDIHLMYRHPLAHLETLVSLRPHLVIIHAEAEGDLLGMMTHLQGLGIQAGVALLQDTVPAEKRELIAAADHVLLFMGKLGSFGGQADLQLLPKVAEVKAINPSAEIGWDGGANQDNAFDLAQGGIDVINVGGAIQKAADPHAAYATIVSKI